MTSYQVPLDLLKRYAFCGDKKKLFRRVVNNVVPTHQDKNIMYRAMIEEKFIPAGNTLVAGIQPLRPNCAIIGSISDINYVEKLELFIRLLTAAIGCGMDFSECEDPVEVLKLYAQAAQEIKLKWKRPLRGNMATLSISHPKINEFINCKNNGDSDLSIFNISVSIKDAEINNSDTIKNISESAHRSGDPGVIFIDRVQDLKHLQYEGRIVTSVPCGEQYMFEGETCTLGAINLDAFVTNNYFDFDKYIETIEIAIKFLDSAIDQIELPDQLMKTKSTDLRRIGLGVMGLATTLKTMKIPYESEEALKLSSELAKCLTRTAVATSEKLGQEKGFHKYSNSRRNITVTCLQPTGGIRRLVAEDGFSIEPLFAEATSVSPLFSVRMAATWQEHIENAVSKTVNLPKSATVADVEKVYRTAFEYGCKGITIYRDGCKENQPISLRKCKDDKCFVE